MPDCPWAEGRRLSKEALSVNTGRGTSPNKDYRHDLPIVRQLVLNAPDVGVDRGRTFINADLVPDEVTDNFIGIEVGIDKGAPTVYTYIRSIQYQLPHNWQIVAGIFIWRSSLPGIYRKGLLT